MQKNWTFADLIRTIKLKEAPKASRVSSLRHQKSREVYLEFFFRMTTQNLSKNIFSTKKSAFPNSSRNCESFEKLAISAPAGSQLKMIANK